MSFPSISSTKSVGGKDEKSGAPAAAAQKEGVGFGYTAKKEKGQMAKLNDPLNIPCSCY